MIRVRLNENSVVDVNTDNPQEAAAAARRWFQQNRPEEFTTWRNSQLGLGSSAVRSASAGIDDFQANLYAAAEGLGRAVSLPSLENFGREGRIANQREAEAAFPEALRQSFLDSEGVGDVARATTEAVGGSLPSSGASMAGALTGARLGASFAGWPGAIGGAILGGAVPSFAGSAGSNIRRQIETSGDITSPGAAFGTAAIQAPLESAADVATLGAARVLRRPVTEAAQAVGAGLGSRVGRGALAGAATETPVEVAQTALERAQAGLPTSLSDPEARREYLEAGLGGLAAGAITGGTLGGVFGQRPAPPADTTTTPDTPIPPTSEGPTPASAPIEEPVAGGRPAPLVMPERPEAFVTPEEAEAFVAENPNFTPPTTLTTPEAAVGFINAARVADWEQQSQQVRQRAITEFFPRAPDTNLPVISEALSNIAVAANQGNLNLNAFSPTAATRAVLAARDIDPTLATRDDIRLVTAELKALEETGVIRKNTVTEPPAKGKKAKKRPTTTYSINYGATTSPQPTPTAQPAPAPAPAAEAAPAPAPVEATPQAEAPVAGEAVAPAPAPDAVPVKPEDEQALWRAYTLNVGPQVSSPFVAAARNIARIRGRGLNRQEFTEFAQQFGNAPTPEVRDQIVNDAVNRPAPAAQPAPDPEDVVAGDPAQRGTLEEAIGTTPADMPLEQSSKLLDKQYKDVFAGDPEGFGPGNIRRLLSSPLTGFSRLPRFRETAETGIAFSDRKLKTSSEFTNLYTPMQELSAESQARAMLALQEASSNKRMWDRNAFSASENKAMDGVIQMGQRGLDWYIDAATLAAFDPSFATNPTDRARLEAFQQRKGDRLITEMPIAEVRAASPAGAREVTRLNSLRNPFYLPQIAKGSHFVAAYERLPGGKKKLVRIYFYKPLKFMQRRRRAIGLQRDFEALSIDALRREFPDSTRYEIMQKGRIAENDKRASKVRQDGEFIGQYLERLSSVSGREAKAVLRQMQAEINKASADRFFKPNNNLLRAVTPWNATDYARETVPNFYLALSNLQAKMAYTPRFNRSIQNYSPEEKQYWNDWFNLNSTPAEAFGSGRALAAGWFLGLNLSSALIQLSQNPLLLPPKFLKYGLTFVDLAKYGGAAALKVYGHADTATQVLSKETTYSSRMLKRGRLTKFERDSLKRAFDEGVVRPSQITSIKGQFDADDIRALGLGDTSATAFASRANKILDLSMRFLSNVDETNRLVAFLAALNAAAAKPEVIARASRYDNRDFKTPYDFARNMVERTNFMGRKEDQPLITTFHPVAQVATQFLTPQFKLLEEYASTVALSVRGMREKDPTMAAAAALSFALMISLQIAVAGIWSLPFADRLKELVEFVLKQADIVVDFEQELEKLPINSLLASILNFGVPHAYNMVTLTERLKVDVLPQGDPSEWNLASLIGPIGGLFEIPFNAISAWLKGDYWGVAYAIFPTSVANITKAGQLALTEQMYTRAGNRIITPDDIARAREGSFLPPEVKQAIGFVPPEFTDVRRAVQRGRELRDAVRNPTERANIELAYLLMQAIQASRAGRQDEAVRFSTDYQNRFREITAEQADKPQHLQIQLTHNSILQRALQDLEGRGSREVLQRSAPIRQREEVGRMYERTIGP